MHGDAPWRGWLNAEIYDQFVREHGIYRELNRHLVELAQVRSASAVLDLACGGGATAEACLAVLPPEGVLVGVDASEEMVEVARARILDPRAEFRVLAAARVGSLDRRFDRAVCNAAFWQFPAMAPVLRSLATVLLPGSLFVFNIPVERVRGETPEIHPFQVALARQIEEATGRRLPGSPTLVDRSTLERKLRAHGFALVKEDRFAYQARQAELIALMRIPAMIGPLAPELSPEERNAVVDAAAERTDPGETVQVPWLYFVARRI